MEWDHGHKQGNAPCRPSATRRATLGGLAAAATAAILPARAAIIDFVVIGKGDWLFATYDEVRHTDFPRIKMVTQVITEAVAILKHAGIETVMCLTPAKARIYRDALPTDFQFTADSDKRYAQALGMLRIGGTLAPDLAAVLLEQRRVNTDEPLFLKADTHWTGPGAETAAIEMAKRIKAHIRLPPSAKPGTQLGPMVVVKQVTNDLAEGLPDVLEAKYPAQSFRVHQVAQSTAPAALIEDDTADVLLVGNSYMQPKYGFAAMLSNQLERPVALAWKVHQSSPYRTLLDTLGAERFRRQKPRLLVWDFEETDMVVTADQAGVWGQNVIGAKAFLAALSTTLGLA